MSNGLRVTVEPSQTDVVPGRVVEFVVNVFTSGATVAEFEAALVGMEPSWFTAAPAQLSLLPNASGSFRARLAVQEMYPSGILTATQTAPFPPGPVPFTAVMSIPLS